MQAHRRRHLLVILRIEVVGERRLCPADGLAVERASAALARTGTGPTERKAMRASPTRDPSRASIAPQPTMA